MNVRRNSFLFYTALLALAVGVCVLPTAAWALSAGTTIDMSDPNPPPSGTNWIYAGDVYTIQGDVAVTGDNQLPNPSQRRISVTAGPMATITLDGVSITGPDDFQSPLLLNSGANVTLKWTEGSTNTLATGNRYAGIQTTGATLTIEGPNSGSLTATGGESCAGIGGGSSNPGGQITITGGTVTATGGTNAAGIGGGYNSSGGQITITGGTVTAIGATNGAGIGGGMNGSGGVIDITGGTVTATGGAGSSNGTGGGAGIGSGGTRRMFSVAAGTITITVPVTAAGGVGGGAGRGADIGAGGFNGGDGPEEAGFHTIEASAGPNGHIVPSGNVKVFGGIDATFTLSPDIGYVVDIVSADNVSVGAVNSHTFDDVAENHTIEAAFRQLNTSTTPTEVSVTHLGTKITAQLESGTYVIEVPEGTDVSNLTVHFDLPDGATISPANDSAQDFSGGPIAYTITAEDGITAEVVTVQVQFIASPPPIPTPTPRKSDGVGCGTGAGMPVLLALIPILRKKRVR